MTQQLHIGVQLYIVHSGNVLVDAALGDARPGPLPVPLRPDTLMLWLSAGKPLTAAAIALLWEQGKLQLDDPIARYIPPFAQYGKDQVTIRHVLTHTAGLRGLYPGPVTTPWEESIASLCAGRMEPDWPPGTKAGYHPYTSWSLLGEIIRRIDGRSCADYVHQEICRPLGMNDTWLALTPAQQAAYGPRLGQLMVTTHGRLALSDLDTPERSAHCRPASSARGPIRELGYFYEMLLGRGQRRTATGQPLGPRLLQEKTVAEMTRRQRTDMVDLSFKQKMDWGLGLLMNSAHYAPPNAPPGHPYGYGPYAGRDAFGHGGAQSSLGMADPEHELVVGAHFNGCPGEPAHDRHNRAFFKALYEDLGLA